VCLVMATLLAIVANNVGGSMMAFVMPAYPAYLLYGTTLLYTIIFFFIAKIQDKSQGGPFGPSARSCLQQKQILWLTLWTSLNGLLFQFSDPWVAGVSAQILGNLSIPAVYLASVLLIGERFTIRENLGVSVVLAGIAIGMLPEMFKKGEDSSGTQSNPLWAVLAFGISAAVQGLEMTFQDRAMKAPYLVRPATALFWYNLYSFVPYLVTVPLEAVPYLNGEKEGKSLVEAFENQKNAIYCALGVPFSEDTEKGNCLAMSWFWPQVFVLGYVGMFYLNAILMKKFNALWVSIINTLGGPLAAVAFTFPSIVGEGNVKALNWPSVNVSFLFILAGVFIKGLPAKADKTQLQVGLEDQLQGDPA